MLRERTAMMKGVTIIWANTRSAAMGYGPPVRRTNTADPGGQVSEPRFRKSSAGGTPKR
jgi:hypothetical protein